MDNLNKEELEREFSTTLADDIIIHIAYYEQADYEGYAFVLFEQEGRLFEVNASHCSCYGLEEQWEPEETTVESLQHRLDKGHGFNYFDRDAVQKFLDSRREA